ncbi:hypothetical protein K402DRAFT_227190 [Aulographum hederae CBS 113979]|uniref:Uncharacterized protein n=1 Tax=Aulographum hederae CBS 113979 TaxID=1176131 RepID=A0A6G1HBB0_9PEZI|nr:hypothetical protein K402DRAFT_227190 [Aulographum hederae CBS 113979]
MTYGVSLFLLLIIWYGKEKRTGSSPSSDYFPFSIWVVISAANVFTSPQKLCFFPPSSPFHTRYSFPSCHLLASWFYCYYYLVFAGIFGRARRCGARLGPRRS